MEIICFDKTLALEFKLLIPFAAAISRPGENGNLPIVLNRTIGLALLEVSSIKLRCVLYLKLVTVTTGYNECGVMMASYGIRVWPPEKKQMRGNSETKTQGCTAIKYIYLDLDIVTIQYKYQASFSIGTSLICMLS